MTVLAKLLFRTMLQQVQHLQDHSSECLRQLFRTVGPTQRGYVHERWSALAQVQRRVVGVVTQVSNESQNTHGVQRFNRENPYMVCDAAGCEAELLLLTKKSIFFLQRHLLECFIPLGYSTPFTDNRMSIRRRNVWSDFQPVKLRIQHCRGTKVYVYSYGYSKNTLFLVLWMLYGPHTCRHLLKRIWRLRGLSCWPSCRQPPYRWPSWCSLDPPPYSTRT